MLAAHAVARLVRPGLFESEYATRIAVIVRSTAYISARCCMGTAHCALSLDTSLLRPAGSHGIATRIFLLKSPSCRSHAYAETSPGAAGSSGRRQCAEMPRTRHPPSSSSTASHAAPRHALPLAGWPNSNRAHQAEAHGSSGRSNRLCHRVVVARTPRSILQ
jgi:hypothetical protein